MMTISELSERWNDIPQFSDGYLLVSGDHPLSFHIGYHGDEQKSFVVLDTGKIPKIVSSKAITAECIETDNNEYAVRFSLNFPSLDEIFVKLCWDLIDVSRNADKPVHKIIERYDQWMRLMQRVADGVMSSSSQKGLIGELLHFQKVLTEMSSEQALTAWVGPEGSDQDYIFHDYWVEVKAVSIAASEVEISSLQQLDRNDTGFLFVYFMDKTTSNGSSAFSLPEVIEKIMPMLQSEKEYDIFGCKLAKYGYQMKDEAKYCGTRYRLSEIRSYKMCDKFPRMIRGNVPTAVVSVHYGLSLSAIEEFRIPEE